jgi:hypothetical protein
VTDLPARRIDRRRIGIGRCGRWRRLRVRGCR